MTPAPASKETISVDFDDTVVPYLYELIETYNRECGGSLEIQNTYGAGELGNPEYGWKHDLAGAIEWINEFLARPSSLDVPPIEGAADALSELSSRFNIAIITGRPQSIDHLIDKWLKTHMPNLVEQIYHAGDTPKSVVCQEIGADYHIDDSPRYIKDCYEAGIKVIAFGDYPWLNEKSLPAGVVRAKTWKMVLEYFNGR